MAGSTNIMRRTAKEEFHIAELFVCDAKQTDLSIRGKKRFHATQVHVCILIAGAMTHINGELEHGEAITLQIFPEKSVSLLLFHRSGRQIKEDKNPHHAILTDPAHGHSG